MICRALRFLREESGTISVMSVTWLPVTLALGGLALDTTNAMRVRAHLQVAADAGAHAALYTRDTEDQHTARAAARAVIETSLPAARHGDVVRDEDIEFGVWDPEAGFTVVEESRSAVRVDLSRVSDRDNPVTTFLLGLAGFDEWNITRLAVFETWRPQCLREGFVAEGVVDLRSNNSYYNGFCIHSNTTVELQQNNSFETGVTVSMPDSGTIVLPASGFEKNEGLEEALRDGSYNIRILNDLAELVAEAGVYASSVMPDYVTGAAPIALPSSKLGTDDFTPGRIHTRTCGGSGRIQIENDTVLQNVVIATDCEIKFGQGVILEDSLVATSNTDANSINAASGVQIGRDDDCAPDGGAQILTMGGVSIPANLEMYGGQIIAAGNIEFTANADGIEGASMISGGEISGTSNMTMGFCDSGMEDNFEYDYFRLAL